VRITYFIGEVATSGFSLGFGEGIVSFFNFICIICAIILIMNLLPIPMLDGGFIAIFLFEMITRKSIKPKFLYRFQLIGFVIIISIFIFALVNDILFFI
jgi:regulator of sigma E protease